MKKPRWQLEGQEPDYRFSLANERTFLAWIRTALALLAGGVLLDQFAAHLNHRSLLVAVGAALSIFASVLSLTAYGRWKGNERAMRHAAPLPATPAILLLSLVLSFAALVLGLLALVD